MTKNDISQQSHKLALKDKRLFNKYLALSKHVLAAFSFANIYIWKSLFDIHWVIIDHTLCVFFRDKIGCFMYLPPLAGERRPEALKKAFTIMDGINKNKDISRIENIELQDLDYYRALGYIVRQKYPDYLCLRSDLAKLSGNKFKSQRASYNYFIKHQNFNARKLRVTDKTDCLNLFSLWLNERKGKSSDEIYCGMLDDNRKVISEALVNYKQLGFAGIAVMINREIKGFTFGYKLSKDTFCVLYEITDLAIKGLAQFIFRKLCEELKIYKYINIMDDSGLENLRKVKLSYKPTALIPAYIASRDV
ncbi:MAG: phosphatidylglycerol lysyltransferase domain-containing protein [Candidatus Omnitrophica bacterium]|nr:phosphatidylglycerol lysyltransferase domain-containing protein [Candidatus Omnitrophota bacterium]